VTLTARIGAWDTKTGSSARGIAAEALALLLAVMAVHYAIYSGSGQWTDADSPFHHLLIAGIWQGGLWQDVTWLPYTILREAGPDHHWLWHLLLSPFAAIDDLQTRVDVANAFSFALIPVATLVALRLLNVRYALFWVLLALAVTYIPIYRWSMGRAQNLAFVYLAFFLVALAARNRLLLFLIPFLFMHSYHGAAMIAAPALLMFVVLALREREAHWALLLWPAAGGALALVTSPWYPHNIEYFLFHTLDKVGNPLGLDVGGEWYPLKAAAAAKLLLPQIVVLAVALAAAGPELRRRLAPETWVALGVTVLLLLGTLQHRRFIEYCPQLLVMSAALVVRDCSDRILPRVRVLFPSLAAAAALVVFTLALLLMDARHRVQYREYLDRDRDIGALLTAHSEPGAIILNTRWDEFPFLVYHAPTLRFVTGLDPYYLAYGDAERFIALQRLVGYAPGYTPAVAATFNTDWVVTNQPDVVNRLVASNQARAVLRNDRQYVVYVGSDPAMPARLQSGAGASFTLLPLPANGNPP